MAGPDLPEPFEGLDPARLRARRGVKWARYADRPEVLAAWVADMDFPIAPAIARALHDAIAQHDLGYPAEGARSGVPEAFCRRYEARFGWAPPPDRVHVIPDVMHGVELAIRATTRPGDAVLVTTPVYPPFLKVVPGTDRVLAECELREGWRLDADRLREVAGASHPSAILLCNPHNPTGRVLTPVELAAVAEVAAEHDATIISDEIHADLVYEGTHHLPIAALGAEVEARSLTLNSASKAFNVAGLRCAVLAAGSDEHHRRITATVGDRHEPVGSLGVTATLAAWTPEGDEWLAQCMAVLDANRRRVVERVVADLPGVATHLPEATYLLWLDCRAAALGADPARWFLREAGVALSAGQEFGHPGEGFVRLNAATSPAILDEILDRMASALQRR